MRQDMGCLMLALLVAMSSALAQTENSQTMSAQPDGVAVARCAYAQTDEPCASVKAPGQPLSARGDDKTLAQLPGPRQGPPMERAAYPGPWMSTPSPGHALIGGLIGFGFGAAAGAKNGGVGGALAVGSLVGLIGAAIGATVPSFPRPNRYRRGWPDYDEDASRSKPARSRRATAGRSPARPDAPQSTGNAANPPLAAETPQEIAISRR